MRKTASIETIKSVESIENADSIEKVNILEYQCVVKKGEFSVGQRVVYIPTDTVVPNKPQFEFLKSKNFRVKPIKLRGVLSQGLVFKISDFPELQNIELNKGDGIGDVLGIQHYEKPIPLSLSGKVKGNRPDFVPKSDEENLRSYPELIREFREKPCYISKKVDGSACYFYKHEGKFGVCSRRLDLKPDDNNIFWKIAKQLDLEFKLQNYPNSIIIQGEAHGQKIRNNPLGVDGIDFRVFDIIVDSKYLSYKKMVDICRDLSLKFVEVIWCDYLYFSIDELINLANKQYYPNGKPCEGIVIRPIEYVWSEILRGRLSAKVINENYKD